MLCGMIIPVMTGIILPQKAVIWCSTWSALAVVIVAPSVPNQTVKQ